MSTAGREKDTAIGDIVLISVRSDGQCGILLEPGRDGNGAIIRAWERLPNGKFGPVQKHGGVHIGDIILSVNGHACDQMYYNETVAMLQDRNVLTKEIKFMNSIEYYRSRTTSSRLDASNGRDNNKASFLSIIRRSRINQSGSSKFVEYEIASQYKLPSTKVEKEKVYKWSVWKRYSEFERANEQLRESLGWQMEGIDFPSPHTFAMNKFSAEFIENRREELNRFWQRLIAIDKITEFHKHHCSDVLKIFVDVAGVLRGDREIEQPPAAAQPNATSVTNGNGNADLATTTRCAPKPNRRQSMRKSASVKQSTSEHGSTAVKPKEVVTSPDEKLQKPSVAEAVEPEIKLQNANHKVTSSTPKGEAPLPPKPTGARMNLLSEINSKRKD